MAPTPCVSVLLPAYNAAATLGECLTSIAMQSERDFECIVVDDGSDDITPRIAERHAAQDSRFRVFPAPHSGVAAAHNRALAESSAPFVARMDADDRMHPDRLRRQLETLAHDTQLDAVGTHIRYFPRSTLGTGMLAYESWLNTIRTANDVRRESFIECPVANPTLMWRRDRFSDLRYREGIDWPEDYDLVLRHLAHGHKIGIVPEPLHDWRHHAGRLTETSEVYADDRFTACKAHYLASEFLANHDAVVLWGYGRTGRVLARALRERQKSLSRIVELHPGRIGQRIQGATVIRPTALGPPRGRRLLASVAGAVARSEIRTALAQLGWREGSDFLCVA